MQTDLSEPPVFLGVGGWAKPLESAAPACGEPGRVTEHPFKICQTLSENLSLQQPRPFRRADPERPRFDGTFSQNRPKSHPKSLPKFARFLVGFLSILGAKMETKIAPKPIKIDLETSSNPESDFARFLSPRFIP